MPPETDAELPDDSLPEDAEDEDDCAPSDTLRLRTEDLPND
jgi:hypothetical protein